MKTFTELASHPLPIFDTSFPEDFPVSFQTHSQCQLLKLQDKKQKQKLFGQVFHFVTQLIENQQFYNNIRQFLLRHDLKNSKFNDKSSQSRIPFQNLSFKKVQITSKECFQGSKSTLKPTQKAELTPGFDRKCGKKISIIVFNNDEEEEMFSSNESLVSDEEVKTLKQIKLPTLKLTEDLVKQIYQAPSPFLINLSLCLLMRYCIKRNAKPDWNDAGWILAIATIEAFKLFYDEELEGMFECFEETLKISRNDLVDLERCFLEKIDYNVIIQNYDYQFILTKLVEMEKLKEQEEKQKDAKK